jgi:hypothetical protein
MTTQTKTTDMIEDTTATSTEKRKGGRKANPNNLSIRARNMLVALPADQLKKDIAVPKLVAELGCKDTSAMTYFYTYKAELSRAAKAATQG